MQKNRRNGFVWLSLLVIVAVVIFAVDAVFYFEQKRTQPRDSTRLKWPVVQQPSVENPELQISELPLLRNKKAEEELKFAKLKLGIQAKYAGSILTTQQKNRVLVLSANKCFDEDCRAYGIIVEGECVVGDAWVNPDATYHPLTSITDCWTDSCATIENDDAKNLCLALIEKDYDRCSRLLTTDGLGRACFSDAYLEAVKNGDEDICGKIMPEIMENNDRNSYSLRSLCYKEVAKKNNDIKICANIVNDATNGYQKKLCFGHVLKNNQGSDICGRLSEVSDREFCSKILAEIKVDPLEGDSFLVCLKKDEGDPFYYWKEADCAKAMKEATGNATCFKRCAESGFGKPVSCNQYDRTNDCCCENVKCVQKGGIADEMINQDCCSGLVKVKISSEGGARSLCVKIAEQKDGALCNVVEGDADCASGYGCDLQPAGAQSVCKPLPSCVSEGQSVNLYREALAKSPRCCAGMTAVALDWIPNGEGKCAAQIQSKSYACIKCGDGVCGDQENKCNCAKDCSGGKNDYWLAASYLGSINLPKNECRVFLCHGDIGLSGESPTCDKLMVADISLATGSIDGEVGSFYGRVDFSGEVGKCIICSVSDGMGRFHVISGGDSTEK